MHNGNTRGEQNGIEDVFEAIMTQNFPQINVRYQTTDPERSEHQAG